MPRPVLARIIEPVSKLNSLRVLAEAGLALGSHATLKRRLPSCAKDSWRRRFIVGPPPSKAD